MRSRWKCLRAYLPWCLKGGDLTSIYAEMKFYPPRFQIDENDPFKGALFGRKDFALALTNLLRHAEENVVIFINAPWGHGKTTFARMWLAHFKNEKQEAIYYNAYASDYFDDPFVSFSGEILALVKKRLAEAKGVEVSREAFKRAAINIAKRLVGVGVKAGVKAASIGLIEPTDLKELKDIAADATKDVSEIAGDVIEKRIENYTKEKDTLDVFKENLGKLAKLFREEQGFPLTIIVDELDRCRPDFALGLLERIKHLFDVENVAFVLLVNRDQIERYVEKIYGHNPNAAAFLMKFGSVFVDLPTTSSSGRMQVSGSDEFCDSLNRHFDIHVQGDDGPVVLHLIQICAKHFELTLREIEKVFTVLALYYGSGPHQFTDPIWIPILAVLKIKNPKLYMRLSVRDISVTDFFNTTRLDKLGNLGSYSLDGNYVVRSLRNCLLSQAEYNGLAETERLELSQWGWEGSFRLKAVPLFCAALEQFSIKLT